MHPIGLRNRPRDRLTEVTEVSFYAIMRGPCCRRYRHVPGLAQPFPIFYVQKGLLCQNTLISEDNNGTLMNHIYRPCLTLRDRFRRRSWLTDLAAISRSPWAGITSKNPGVGKFGFRDSSGQVILLVSLAPDGPTAYDDSQVVVLFIGA